MYGNDFLPLSRLRTRDVRLKYLSIMPIEKKQERLKVTQLDVHRNLRAYL